MSHISDELWARIARSTGGGPELRSRLNEAIDYVRRHTVRHNANDKCIMVKRELRSLLSASIKLKSKLDQIDETTFSTLFTDIDMTSTVEQKERQRAKTNGIAPCDLFDKELFDYHFSILIDSIKDGISRTRVSKKGISINARRDIRDDLIQLTDYAIYVNGGSILSNRFSQCIGWLFDFIRIVDPYVTEGVVKSDVRRWLNLRDKHPDVGIDLCRQEWERAGNREINDDNSILFYV